MARITLDSNSTCRTLELQINFLKLQGHPLDTKHLLKQKSWNKIEKFSNFSNYDRLYFFENYCNISLFGIYFDKIFPSFQTATYLKTLSV